MGLSFVDLVFSFLGGIIVSDIFWGRKEDSEERDAILLGLVELIGMRDGGLQDGFDILLTFRLFILSLLLCERSK